MSKPNGAGWRYAIVGKRKALRHFSHATGWVLVFSFVCAPVAPVLAQETAPDTTTPTEPTGEVLPADDLSEEGETPQEETTSSEPESSTPEVQETADESEAVEPAAADPAEEAKPPIEEEPLPEAASSIGEAESYFRENTVLQNRRPPETDTMGALSYTYEIAV